MKVAYLDCFSGISGDMFLGALLHAGLDIEDLRAELEKLGLDEFQLRAEKVWRESMEGVRVEVVLDDSSEAPRRGLSEIKAILAGSALEPEDKARATEVFSRLAGAEALVHGTTPEEVHFHEVGAVDAIVDIVGSIIGLRLLGVEEVYSSRVTLGTGTATCEHGEIPVPVPATMELLKGVPVIRSDLEGELVTPTGAALLSTLCRRTGIAVSFTPASVGYGFGSRERKAGPPNALRLIVGEVSQGIEEVVVLETNLDDTSGQVIGYLIERVLRAGALDAYSISTQMKKSRPGLLFTVIVDDAHVDEIEKMIFAETPTLGIRRQRVTRSRLMRTESTVNTSLGKIRVKFVVGPDGQGRSAPEYEDVARVATETGRPFRHVLDAIQRELPSWPSDEGAAE